MRRRPGPVRSRPPRYQRPWAWAALVFASAGPFAVGLGFEHVYDDRDTLVATPAATLPLGELASALLHGRADLPDVSRPAMVLSARLDHVLWGASPVGTHLGSLALYVLTTATAWRLALVLLRSRRLALGATTLWAAMPVHAECVVSASYREDLFAALGVLGGLAALLAPAREPHSWARASGLAALVALGLAGKESALVIVPLGAALAASLAPRDAGSLAAWAARRERSLVLLALVLASYLAWRYQLAGVGDGVARAAPDAHGPHDDARYLVWAALRSAWPLDVEPLYPEQPHASAGWWLPLGAMAAATAWARHTPAGRAGLFVLLGALVTAPLVGPANARADRYLLFTTLGTAMLAMLALDAVARRAASADRARLVTASAVGVVTVALGCRSAVAAQVWSSDLALWSHATERAPESAKAWQGLAWAQRRAGALDDAAQSLSRSLALDPERPETRLSAAYLALRRGDVAGARRTLEALRADGHEGMRGWRRAARCAFDVPAEDAAACIDAPRLDAPIDVTPRVEGGAP